eukprot:GFKZ01007824.1.p1 GENE.GFKZ01007824.1~~GFKZ01007824.1.p1  ORF type:complete len:156 (+),score=0.79 GFKZ01007824.1:391-858(+)
MEPRPVDIPIHPRSSSHGSNSPPPVAYEITVSSPFQQSFSSKGARKACEVPITSERRKMRDFATEKAAILGQAGCSELGWHFLPVTFDSLVSPSETTSQVVHEHAATIAARIGSSTARVTFRLHQKPSYAFLSICAASVIGRSPHCADVCLHLQS